MKNKALPLSICLLLTVFCVMYCDKDVEERALPSFESTAIDATGGTWRPIILGSATDVSVAPASTTGSADYLQEIGQIVQMQQSISNADRTLIDQWKGNGVLRWNEKIRALVARYNLAPEPNPDGTYPAPSAANPAGPPEFPFANPVYSGRAYAYFSVAMYDALIACWYYKFRNNRPQPAVASNLVQALESYQIDMPGYPSADAVMAQVGYRMLKTLFPMDSAEILNMANGHKRAKLLSGMASPSDIAAGEAIANAVVDKVMARFRTDGMGQSLGSPAQWVQLAKDAAARGISTTWKSMEIPARPPMLPFFGNVKLWTITTAQRDSLRPPPPPAIGSEAFNKDMDELRIYTSRPTDEQWRIATFWADGLGSFTPPGHWNEIAGESIARHQLSEIKTARAMALVNMALCDAGICCWDAKSYYFYPRPTQMDEKIKTIGLPNFPSYTSGHSTFSGAAATVLSYLFPDEAQRFNDMAQEASVSRIYGGIHYRFDCEAGLTCGKAIGSFSVRWGQTDGSN